MSASRAASALFDSVEHLPLHAVLELAPPQHQVEDFVDGVLWILLQSQKVREDDSVSLQLALEMLQTWSLLPGYTPDSRT